MVVATLPSAWIPTCRSRFVTLGLIINVPPPLQAESGRTPGSYFSPGIVELDYGVEMTMVRLGEGSVTMVCNSERPFGMDA